MANITDLKPNVLWQQIETTQEDWEEAGKDVLLNILCRLHLIRAFEEKILELDRDGITHGPIHTSIGHEAASVASILPLRVGDQILATYRAHHHFLSKGLGYLDTQGHDYRCENTPVELKRFIRRTMAEIIGLEEGFCGGRGGSFHLRWAEAGFQSSNAIVGGHIPLATGVAWANKHQGKGNVTFAYLGDGSMHIGEVQEAFNLAALYQLPICFFIENNGYAVSTTVEEQTRETRLSSRGCAYGIPAFRVDGMDPVAVKLATEKALEIMRNNRGPVIIEATVYRYFHHSGGARGSAFGYRSKDEEAEWKEKDPLVRVAKELIDREWLDAEGDVLLRQKAQALMKELVDEITEPMDGRRQIIPSLWPDPETITEGVRGDLEELDGLRYEEIETYSGPTREEKFITSVAGVMERRMEADERIFCIGEDIHKLSGGPKGATRGLVERFPDRIIGTPIAEAGFTGLAGGAAMEGSYRPVVELMYPDFALVAADQLFNQIGKARHMFGGELKVPLVLRTAVSLGTGYGAQHSMDPAGLFAQFPGWRIVAPSSPFDYIGLMNSALRCEDPVLVIEHAGLFKTKGPVPVDDLDYYIPFGKAKVVRSGKDMTILSYLAMVPLAVSVADQSGVDAEVVDLRTLDIDGLDWETIGASIVKTGNVLIIEEGSKTASYGSLLVDEIQQRFFDYLDQPIKRVHGSEASPTCSKRLEARCVVNSDDVRTGLAEILENLGKEISSVA